MAEAEQQRTSSSEATETDLELMDLPDEVLETIFGWLDDVGEVLRLRVVCKRWNELLQRPDAWRERDVVTNRRGLLPGLRFGQPCSMGLLRAVLRFAPCLRVLELDGDALNLPVLTAELLADSVCAVRELSVTPTGTEDLALCAAVVYHQVTLGRLRRLTVVHGGLLSGCKGGRALVQVLCVAPGLERLLLVSHSAGLLGFGLPGLGDPEPVPLLPPPGEADVAASLTRLTCTANALPEDFLTALLRRHAPTLEEVELRELSPVTGVDVAALLSGAPRLRKLRCPPLPQMHLLAAACPDLAELCLNAEAAGAAGGLRLKETADFLTGVAARLRFVRLSVGPRGDAEAGDVEAAVRALAASGRAAVRCLDLIAPFMNGLGPSPAGLGPVPAGLGPSLAALPHLETLRLDMFAVTTAFLEAVTPGSAPRLRWLSLREPEDACCHAWVHGAPVAGMLRRNPRLHLQFTAWANACPDEQGCAPCRQGCHFAKEVGAGQPPVQPDPMMPGLGLGLLTMKTGICVTVFAHAHLREGAPCGERHFDRHWYELEPEM